MNADKAIGDGSALLAIVLAMGGFAWDIFGFNAIERAPAMPGCAQISQAAKLEPHELSNLPSSTDPHAAESHVNIHQRFKAAIPMRGQGRGRVRARDRRCLQRCARPRAGRLDHPVRSQHRRQGGLGAFQLDQRRLSPLGSGMARLEGRATRRALAVGRPHRAALRAFPV